MDALPSHELGMTVLMTPYMANFAGNVHGGIDAGGDRRDWRSRALSRVMPGV